MLKENIKGQVQEQKQGAPAVVVEEPVVVDEEIVVDDVAEVINIMHRALK